MTGGFEITLKDVYDEVKNVDTRIEVVNVALTRVDGRLDTVDTRFDSGDRKFNDQELRIRALERFRFTIVGAAVGAGMFTSAVGALVDWALTHH